MLKKIIKKVLPKSILNSYHKTMSLLGANLFFCPSNKMIVIGVTGTNGKSTVTDMISYFLENLGYKVGSTSTVGFKIGNKTWLNDKKMTMIGRFGLQKMLHQMVKTGCQYAVIETSSEGIKQFRHSGINYDVVVFTNLTPEHLESHGGFDNYKNCKLELFKHLTKYGKKIINGKTIEKVVIANRDDNYSSEFMAFDADKKIDFSINKESAIQAEDIELKPITKFSVNGIEFEDKLIGEFNIYNVLAAMSVIYSQEIDISKLVEPLKDFIGTPGRMEFINEGQNFKVMIDYAPEIESLKQLYKTIDLFYYQRLIHILGSCGGGRDKDRQPIMGAMAGEKADIVIVTNEDPYDDDPIGIIDNVASGAIEKGKILNENLFKIEDRKKAIEYAINIAGEDDLILITGKGAEQFICIKDNKKIRWDDRKVVREILTNLKNE
ncbi:MAG: UDP-N-acetylmuramoyl-L-alanyl-D-glutamate--2,6-diaminopimelate ligase [Patescibacteria group bacterium]|nr:UDP-N-acetylmuramoyl-L-alanyl-D-glutamate--2,6-diaminopimelate ligase [Patescibacteria group bacterium]MDD4303880.1 UDP-N-acetylmuramoyl-L-alanyl-D-glutamate--2,6-diaminopimelate ligase [Patescibacteria group bacterium]MDD4695133.1 UDP-N-acetylmuramoyl-L-alanyl-D-glutamate--2,6-diaminopimelate ligase [Patescibacteria group bacterium]